MLPTKRNKAVSNLAGVFLAGAAMLCAQHGLTGCQASYVNDTNRQIMVGTLEGGIVAIGAEHTGWQLVREGIVTGGPIEVDVSDVQALAGEFEGERVEIYGPVELRQTVERSGADGSVPVVRAVHIRRVD